MPHNLNYQLIRNEDEQICDSDQPICRVIENAGGVPYKIFFGTKPDEKYSNVGPGIKQLLGISQEEFTDDSYSELIEKIIPLSDDVPSDIIEVRKKLASGDLKRFKAEVLIRTKSGEKKWIQDSSLPFLNEKTGEVIGVYGILFDINESKKVLGSLETAMIKAEESDRLKSAFLNNLSHEIRTPLNAIVGFASLLNEPERDYNSRDEFVKIITHSSDHLLEIIDNIVEISNIETTSVKVKREEIKLDNIVKKIYDRFKYKAAEKNIELILVNNIQQIGSKVKTDGAKLTRVLTNLLNNAIKFTKEGRIEFGFDLKAGAVEFFVSDTGIGIAKEHSDKVFNRFYQADCSYTRRFEGTGLGLSIAKAYVELLGGKIWFKSKPGEGSVFYFTVPCIHLNI